MNENEVEELSDRFSWAERILLCVLAFLFLIIVGFSAGLTWLIAPDCECK
jgi:hypothetical protein